MGYLTAKEVKEHFTKIGMMDAVHEIDKLSNSKKQKINISGLYFRRKRDFAKNFGAYSITQGCCSVSLYFECENKEAEKLAEDMGIDYLECDEGWETHEEDDAEIYVTRRWFDNIMHLWVNIYSNWNFDIYQMRFK
jgi:hypothetical protein